ncbi:SprT-like domain-containing protein [Gemmatimonas sp.]|uniref:SprT-like domain-containing protein n=1 Tax=Gemmatimonas sp. TaxID=1962908 RepID=UPI0025C4704E|nr:SprT-like domain-containing protein [Gemmatimonas sp.]MCA2995751.1 SprT-like domain-containing protein [Gemmatimonas sp.]
MSLFDDLQLGFFTEAPAPAPAVPSSSPSSSPSLSSSPSSSQPPESDRGRQVRGRSALRARTAVLFSRLQDMGLRGVEQLVLMRTRTVMVSLIGRTLRVHEGYSEAPETVLRAIVAFATARTRAERLAAREVILAHDVERALVARRQEPARPGDAALLTQLTEAHRQLNAQWFGGTLKSIPLRLSGRMATRLGHYDPGSRHLAAEIVMSRTHIVRHGWREAMHTLLHEMVHQWQHETGRPVDHGPEFRRKAREVGITPAARRDVTPLERRRERQAHAR